MATLIATLFNLPACSFSSGVMQIGPDTYTLSEMRAPAKGGGPEAQRVVVAEAGSFCQHWHRRMLMLSLQPDGDPYTPYFPTAFDTVFRCLPVGQSLL